VDADVDYIVIYFSMVYKPFIGYTWCECICLILCLAILFIALMFQALSFWMVVMPLSLGYLDY